MLYTSDSKVRLHFLQFLHSVAVPIKGKIRPSPLLSRPITHSASPPPSASDRDSMRQVEHSMKHVFNMSHAVSVMLTKHRQNLTKKSCSLTAHYLQ